MFSILLVEDEPQKMQKTLQFLGKLPGISLDNIDHENDVRGAKIKLKGKAYDLLILDIQIPLTKDQPGDPKGGMILLEEILGRHGIYKIPTHIFGLTEKDEIFNSEQPTFQKSLLTLIRYSQSDNEWQEKLRTGISQRIASKTNNNGNNPDYDYDVAIVCALRTELQANFSHGEWKEKEIIHDDTLYYESSLESSNGKTIRLIAANAMRMGMPATGALAMKMITTFRPKYIAMTGIMAGVTGRVNLGDLVVLGQSWDWGSGKWIAEKDRITPEGQKHALFQIDPYQFTLDTYIFREVTRMAEDPAYLYQLRTSFGKGAPDRDLKVHIGPVASGASVLSDAGTFNKIKEQQRKLLGVEMEAYALFSAVECAPRPKPIPICVKSVVDYGDSEKDDDYQSYGAFTSSKFIKDLILRLFND